MSCCKDNTPCVDKHCECAVELDAKCITLSSELECSSISKDLPLNEVLDKLDKFICTKFLEVSNYFNLTNVGLGAKIYGGINGLGEKKIRSLISSDGSVNIVEGTDDIDFSASLADGSETKINSGTNVTITGSGTIVSPYVINSASASIPDLVEVTNQNNNTITKAITAVGFTAYSFFSGVNSFPRTDYDYSGVTIQNTSLEKLVIKDKTITWDNAQSGGYHNILNFDRTASGIATYNFPSKVAGTYTLATTSDIVTPDGSETKINPGTNVTITGSGTIASPYVINSTSTSAADGSETKINPGTNVTITGSGTIASPYIVNATNQGNLQKILTLTDFTSGNYTITQGDNNYVLVIQNGTTPVTITIPTGLSSAHFVGYTQEGTADVTFVASGTTLKSPLGLKIKGQDFQVASEQNLTTNVFHIHGNTKL